MSYGYLKHWATQMPDAPAVKAEGRTLPYGRVLAAVDLATERLRRRGITAGSRVAIQTAIDPVMRQVLYFALDKIGAVSGLVPDAGLKLFDYVLLSTAADGDARFISMGWNALTELQAEPLRHRDESPHNWRDDEPCRIYASSGSTGTPKLIQRSYGLHRRNIDNYHLAHPLGPGDVALNLIGLATPGILLLASAWMRGAAIAVSVPDARRDLFAEIQALGVTAVAAAPISFGQALDSAPPGQRIPTLSIYLYGGRADKALLEQLRARVTDKVALNYGTSEAGLAILTWVGEKIPDRTFGLALPSVRLEIVDDAGQRQAIGKLGLISHQCDYQASDGYLHDNGTVRPFSDRPGQPYISADQGFVDRAGRFHVLGRADDILVLGGQKVPLMSIETQVAESNMCVEYVAFRPAGTAPQDVVWIAAQLRNGHTREGLRDYVRHKFPARVRVLSLPDGLPRLPNEKFDLEQLQRLARESRVQRRTGMPQ